VDGDMGTTITPRTCAICGRSFDSIDELRSHEAEQHPEAGEEQGDTGSDQGGSAGSAETAGEPGDDVAGG
jgi:hypothetical protein